MAVVTWQDWQTVGVAMMSLVFVLYGFAYMIGMGFQLPKVREWARNEFYQAVVSALILGGLVILLASINGMMNNLAGLPGDTVCRLDPDGPAVACPIVTARDFLHDRYMGLVGTYTGMATMNVLIGSLASMRVMVAPHQQGWGVSVTSGLSLVSDLFGIVMQFCGIGIGLLYVNRSVIEFSAVQLMALFPVGCVLRSFPWTRGAGAAIMALCIGLYVVYPLLLTLDAQVVARDAQHIPNSSGTDWNGGLQGWFQEIAYDVVIVAIFLPVFNLSLTFTFTRQLAQLLGGDIDVSALAKLL